MRFLAALFAALAVSAHATTPTTDFSDLWFNPNEEGWGVTVTQQNDIQFITLFVYIGNGEPKWYVGPATAYQGSTVNGTLVFSGPLYEARGPFFGAPTFNENEVVPNQVGQITFSTGQISTATLTYNVGSTNVTKSITRQTWRAENVSGVYVGGSLGNFVGCGGRDGYFESRAIMTVTHDGGSPGNITVREEGDGYTCNYAGTYTQSGRMGSINGNGSCTSGPAQAFIASEVQGGIQGLTMRYGVTFTGACTAVGRMGGVRRGS